MKRLSIIIPHYNTPYLLQKLLDSIPNLEEIEVLVIDDNSDCNKEIYLQCVNENKERNIKFFQNSVALKGAGNARNIGLENATGEWVLFADADDFFVCGFWEIVSRYLDAFEDIIYFLPTSVKLESKKEADRHIYYERLVTAFLMEPGHVNELKLRYTYWSPCTKLIRRALIEKNQIRFGSTMYSNDVMFSTKIGHLAQSIKAVDEVIYCITQSEKSLTAITDKKPLSIRRKVFCKYYFFIHRVLSANDMKALGYRKGAYLYYCLERIRLFYVH